jgi:hypothetical protein
MAKVGEGHFGAWMRQGLRELRGRIYPESNVAQPAEYGMYGTKTPGEVAEQRRDAPIRDLDEEKPQVRESILDQRVKQAEATKDRDQRGMELER